MNEKENYLKNILPSLASTLKGDEKGKWGVMNAQQMVEHFTEALENASGKLPLPRMTKEEDIGKMQQFLQSDHPFRENTKNALMKEEGEPLKEKDMQAALQKLKNAIDNFFETYQQHPEYKSSNPFFGELDYQMNLQLLHKHAMHHLKQFGLQ